jgi:hypothetical protein
MNAISCCSLLLCLTAMFRDASAADLNSPPVIPSLSQADAPKPRPTKIRVKKCVLTVEPAGDLDKNGFRPINVTATAKIETTADFSKYTVLAKVIGEPRRITYSDGRAEVKRLPNGDYRFSAKLRRPEESGDYRFALYFLGKAFHEQSLDPVE